MAFRLSCFLSAIHHQEKEIIPFTVGYFAKFFWLCSISHTHSTLGKANPSCVSLCSCSSAEWTAISIWCHLWGKWGEKTALSLTSPTPCTSQQLTGAQRGRLGTSTGGRQSRNIPWFAWQNHKQTHMQQGAFGSPSKNTCTHTLSQMQNTRRVITCWTRRWSRKALVLSSKASSPQFVYTEEL